LAARGIHTSEQLCERLLEETGVAILPGSSFGRPAQELTARLAYVDFDGARALEAAGHRLPHQALEEDFLRAYCGNVLAGADCLGEWLEG
jgi:aspartate aminotransferase